MACLVWPTLCYCLLVTYQRCKCIFVTFVALAPMLFNRLPSHFTNNAAYSHHFVLDDVTFLFDFINVLVHIAD